MAVVTPVNIIHSSYPHTMALLLLFLLPANASPVYKHHQQTIQERFRESETVEVLNDSRRDTSGDISVSNFSSIVKSDINQHINKSIINIKDHSSAKGSGEALFGCPKCVLSDESASDKGADLTPEEEQEVVRNLRLEMVKAQILTKLELKAPPIVFRTFADLPEEVKNSFSVGDPITNPVEEPRETTNIIVARTQVPCPSSSPKGAQCYSFRSAKRWQKGIPSDGEVDEQVGTTDTSLYFWLPEPQEQHHHNPRVTIALISDVQHHRNHHNHPRSPGIHRDILRTASVTRPPNGWINLNLSLPGSAATMFTSSTSSKDSGELDLSSIMSDGASDIESEVFPEQTEEDLSSEGEMVLEISCRHCADYHQWRESGGSETDSNHKPFLTVRTEAFPHEHHRSKRSVARDCSGDSNSQRCCRDSLYIDFSEMGWNNWIIQPAGFTLYYCKGSCTSPTIREIIQGGNTYDTLLQRLLLSNNLSPAVRAAVAPCCSAKNAEPLSIMWMEASNVVRLNHLPNMVVTECGCAG